MRPNLGSDGTVDYEKDFCQTTWRTWNTLPFSVTWRIDAWLVPRRANVAYVNTRIGLHLQSLSMYALVIPMYQKLATWEKEPAWRFLVLFF